MYEYLKELLPFAELMGEPKTILVHSGDEIFGDDIQIVGHAMEGRVYTIRVTLEEAADAGQS